MFADVGPQMAGDFPWHPYKPICFCYFIYKINSTHSLSYIWRHNFSFCFDLQVLRPLGVAFPLLYNSYIAVVSELCLKTCITNKCTAVSVTEWKTHLYSEKNAFFQMESMTCSSKLLPLFDICSSLWMNEKVCILEREIMGNSIHNEVGQGLLLLLIFL